MILARPPIPATPSFVKSWAMGNPGSTPWNSGYRLQRVSGTTLPVALSVTPTSGRQVTRIFRVTGSQYTPNGAVQRWITFPNNSTQGVSYMRADGSGNIRWTLTPLHADLVGLYPIWTVDSATTSRQSTAITDTIAGNPLCSAMISSISPTTVVESTFDITINGTRFDAGAIDQVFKGGVFIWNGQVQSRTSTQIVVRQSKAGADSGVYAVKVRNSNGALTNGVYFTLMPAGPVINSSSPTTVVQSTFDRSLRSRTSTRFACKSTSPWGTIYTAAEAAHFETAICPSSTLKVRPCEPSITGGLS